MQTIQQRFSRCCIVLCCHRFGVVSYDFSELIQTQVCSAGISQDKRDPSVEKVPPWAAPTPDAIGMLYVFWCVDITLKSKHPRSITPLSIASWSRSTVKHFEHMSHVWGCCELTIEFETHNFGVGVRTQDYAVRTSHYQHTHASKVQNKW